MNAVKSVPKAENKKIFVLDTNVLMHDPTSLFRFEEHDVHIPMQVLEELDHHKRGQTDIARNVRQATRMLDEIINGVADIKKGLPLERESKGQASGCLFLQTEHSAPTGSFTNGDSAILSYTRLLKDQFPNRIVVFVSKDINARIKAKALGLAAEDYSNDKVIEDSDVLYTGFQRLDSDFWTSHKGIESWKKGEHNFYKLRAPLCGSVHLNEFVYVAAQDGTEMRLIVTDKSGDTMVLQSLRDYTNDKNNVWGIKARNREQSFALNALMNPDIDLVTVAGQAGTGKTLLTLAAALSQALDGKLYSEIIFTRITVPVGEDIGFLPGTEEEKMTPWMGALEDNLDVLNGGGKHGESKDWERASARELMRSRLKVKSLTFMRGRTFLNKFLIIDEAQNLTPKQMKTLITRAGPGTKVVCLGNVAQIDTPYLTEASSGLTYAIERFKGWRHSAHVTLAKGERSRLADYAGEAL